MPWDSLNWKSKEAFQLTFLQLILQKITASHEFVMLVVEIAWIIDFISDNYMDLIG